LAETHIILAQIRCWYVDLTYENYDTRMNAKVVLLYHIKDTIIHFFFKISKYFTNPTLVILYLTIFKMLSVNVYSCTLVSFCVATSFKEKYRNIFALKVQIYRCFLKMLCFS